MLELIVVRHAIACERNARRWPDDGDRPLTHAGKKRFRQAVLGLERIMEPVDCVLTSPCVRARATAAILTRDAGWGSAIECVELAPRHNVVQLLCVLQRLRHQRLAIVGHEPGLGKLVALYVDSGAGSVQLKKGGVAELCFEHAFLPKQGKLRGLWTPRVLLALRN